MPFSDDPRRPGCFDPRTNENRLRIAVPERLQHLVPMQQIEVDLRQRYFRVEVQSWSEPFVRQLPARGIQLNSSSEVSRSINLTRPRCAAL